MQYNIYKENCGEIWMFNKLSHNNFVTYFYIDERMLWICSENTWPYQYNIILYVCVFLQLNFNHAKSVSSHINPQFTKVSFQ